MCFLEHWEYQKSFPFSITITSLISSFSLDIFPVKIFSPPPMENYNVFYVNVNQTSIQGSRTYEYIKTGLVILIFLCLCFLLYFVTILVYAIFTTVHIQENARYVLFAHMLVNDTLYVSVGLALLMANIYSFYSPAIMCFLAYTLASSTFRVTPYNLAVMSLERYVAICFPLRHVVFCTVRRANLAILIIWVLGLIPNIAEFIAMRTAVEEVSSISVVCNQDALLLNPLQSIIRSVTIFFSFALVGLIILYTYIKVMLVARQMTSGKSSALKAGKTVMLHAFQLLLCMTSLMSTFTEKYTNVIDFVPFTKFFLFTCLPRFLSPIIYGIRDELLCKQMKKLYPTKF
ncbi:odorant receptor 131-2-like [Pelodytes ibericus]